MEPDGIDAAAQPARGKIVQELVDLRVELQRLSQLAASEKRGEGGEDAKPEVAPEERSSPPSPRKPSAEELEILQLRRVLQQRDAALSRAEGALEEARRSRSALEARLERTQVEMRSAEAQLAEAGAVARELRQALPRMALAGRAFSEEPRAAAAAAARGRFGGPPDPNELRTPPGDLLLGLVGRLHEIRPGLMSKLGPEAGEEDRPGRAQPQGGSPGQRTPTLMTPGQVSRGSPGRGMLSEVVPNSPSCFSTEGAIDALERQMLSIASQNAALEERIKRCAEPDGDVAVVESLAQLRLHSGGSACAAATDSALSPPVSLVEVSTAKAPSKSPLGKAPGARRSLGDMPMAVSRWTTGSGPPWDARETLSTSLHLPAAAATSDVSMAPTPVLASVERVSSRSPQRGFSYNITTPLLQPRRWHGVSTPVAGGASASSSACAQPRVEPPPLPGSAAPPAAHALAPAARVVATSARSPCGRRASPPRAAPQRATLPAETTNCMTRSAHLTASSAALAAVGVRQHLQVAGASSWQPSASLSGRKGASGVASPPQPTALPFAPSVHMLPTHLGSHVPAGSPAAATSPTQSAAPLTSPTAAAAAPQALSLPLPQHRPRSPSVVQRSPASSPRCVEKSSVSWAPAAFSCVTKAATPTAVQVPVAQLSAVPLPAASIRHGALQAQPSLQQQPRAAVCS